MKTVPVFGLENGLCGRPPNRYARVGQRPRQFERCLPAELNDDAFRFFPFDDIEHVFKSKRFKVEPVGGVVIGRDRFRVRVDHDGLVSGFFKRPDRVDGRVIELDALPDAVGAGTQNNHLGPVRVPNLIFPLIGRVVVRRIGFKFGGAGVYSFIDRRAVMFQPPPPYVTHIRARQRSDVGVCETEPLDLAPRLPIPRFGVAERGDLTLGLGDLFKLRQKPRVDSGFVV